MNGLNVFLDSSSIVKRYVEEVGSKVADAAYEAAEAGRAQLHASIWSVGEILGVFDQYRARHVLTNAKFASTLRIFVEETLKLLRLNTLQLWPVTVEALSTAWQLVLSEHMYIADTLQIGTAREAACKLFLSSDKRLVILARAQGFEAYDVEVDEQAAVKALA